MSNAFAGVGTEFRRWSGSAWVRVTEVRSITGPGKTRDTIDVTNLDSTGGYREFIGGFRDGGTVQLNCNFTRDGYDLMNDDFESDDIQNYEIVFSDDENTTFEFSGLVTEVPTDINPDEAVTYTVTIKISGQVTINSGSGS